MASLRAPALAAFRRLMRAREMAFQGDSEMLVQSRLAVREEFLRHKVRAQQRPRAERVPARIRSSGRATAPCGGAVHVLTVCVCGTGRAGWPGTDGVAARG